MKPTHNIRNSSLGQKILKKVNITDQELHILTDSFRLKVLVAPVPSNILELSVSKAKPLLDFLLDCLSK